MQCKTMVLLIAVFSTACTPFQGNSPAIDPSMRGSDSLAGLSFKPISSSTATVLDGTKSSDGGGVAPATAPMAPMPPSMGCSVAPYYDYGYYGFKEQMSLVAMFEAEAPGYAGNSFQEMLRQIVSPVLKDWANDARLVLTSGSVDGSGFSSNDSSWSLSYASKSREETLDFSVGNSKTRVIRKAWGPLDLAPDKITVDSAVALKVLQDAIPNKDAKSEEARTGMDYFFKTAIPAVDQGTQFQVLYRLPANARWNIRLQSILGHTVWEIDGYSASVVTPTPANEARLPQATPVAQSSSVSEYAYGMIDAKSGALIRLTRPCEYFFSASTGESSVGIIPPAMPVYK